MVKSAEQLQIELLANIVLDLAEVVELSGTADFMQLHYIGEVKDSVDRLFKQFGYMRVKV